MFLILVLLIRCKNVEQNMFIIIFLCCSYLLHIRKLNKPFLWAAILEEAGATRKGVHTTDINTAKNIEKKPTWNNHELLYNPEWISKDSEVNPKYGTMVDTWISIPKIGQD